MTAIRIKDGDHRIYLECDAITIELADGRVVAWANNNAIHIGHLSEGAAIKILEGEKA